MTPAKGFAQRASGWKSSWVPMTTSGVTEFAVAPNGVDAWSHPNGAVPYRSAEVLNVDTTLEQRLRDETRVVHFVPSDRTSGERVDTPVPSRCDRRNHASYETTTPVASHRSLPIRITVQAIERQRKLSRLSVSSYHITCDPDM